MRIRYLQNLEKFQLFRRRQTEIVAATHNLALPICATHFLPGRLQSRQPWSGRIGRLRMESWQFFYPVNIKNDRNQTSVAERTEARLGP